MDLELSLYGEGRLGGSKTGRSVQKSAMEACLTTEASSAVQVRSAIGAYQAMKADLAMRLARWRSKQGTYTSLTAEARLPQRSMSSIEVGSSVDARLIPKACSVFDGAIQASCLSLAWSHLGLAQPKLYSANGSEFASFLLAPFFSFLLHRVQFMG